MAAVQGKSLNSLRYNSTELQPKLSRLWEVGFRRFDSVGAIGRLKCFPRIKATEESLSTLPLNGRSSTINMGKSTLACALSQGLNSKGKLTYTLDGDNCRHGLCCDLPFKAADRAKNIRRVGEVAKLFVDACVICIACLISPYRKDRDGCRAMLPNGKFIEVYMNTPLDVCQRDSISWLDQGRSKFRSLSSLVRDFNWHFAGFTGIDDPYEPPMKCEIVLEQEGAKYASPTDMAETVMCYLNEKEYLHA